MSPPRGFEVSEYQARLARAQDKMEQAELSALLLTTEPDIRYFTGFLTRFWESPTRPWFLIVPQSGSPVAVIPSIGEKLMASCGVKDIRTWRAPDYHDDGVTLLGDTLIELAPGGRIGLPMGLESHLRMPLESWTRLRARDELHFESDIGVMAQLRAIKSDAEIAKIKTACSIADRAFSRVPEIARTGVSLAEVFRRFQMLALEEGADFVAYLAGAAEPGGYNDVISPASERPLATADVLMLDTGVVHDGYFCDFDRNFSLGAPSTDVASAHHRLIDAVDAAADLARPGKTAADLFQVMDQLLTGGTGSDAGRLGHGLGMQLTEGLSLVPDDLTTLEPGMVLTLEPGIEVSQGRILVHEENIVIRENSVEFVSTRSARDILVLEG